MARLKVKMTLHFSTLKLYFIKRQSNTFLFVLENSCRKHNYLRLRIKKKQHTYNNKTSRST